MRAQITEIIRFQLILTLHFGFGYFDEQEVEELADSLIVAFALPHLYNFHTLDQHSLHSTFVAYFASNYYSFFDFVAAVVVVPKK